MSSTIRVLPGVRDALGPEVELLMDGGVRSGLDMFRALALGADGVMAGRPWAFAVAAAGEAGVADVLAGFKRQLTVAMALSGVTSIDQITRDLVTDGADDA